MSDQPPRSFAADFKLFFLRGLVVVLPSVLTLWIVVKAYQFVDGTIAEPINHGIRLGMHSLAPVWSPLSNAFDPAETAILDEYSERFPVLIGNTYPTDDEITAEALRLGESNNFTPDQDMIVTNLRRAKVDEFRASRPEIPGQDVIAAELRWTKIVEWWQARRSYLNLIGLFVAITAVYIAGRLLGGFLGRRIYRRLERSLISIPIIKQVYPYVKQVVDFLFGQDKKKEVQYSRVVLVQYPRKGLWSLGLATGEAMISVNEVAGECMTVFIPSSPTPFTGYTLSVPRSDVIDLPITVDEALRFTVSGGVLMPKNQLPKGVDPESIEQPTLPVPTGLLPLTDDDDEKLKDEGRKHEHPAAVLPVRSSDGRNSDADQDQRPTHGSDPGD